MFIKRERTLYGSILGDPLNPGTFWVTRGYHGQFLEQYNSIDRLKNQLIDITFNMQINRYFGTHHAVYNNSFYYQFTGKQHVVRYDLALHDVVTATNPIPGSHFNDSRYLYKDSKTYYDITADENGLWIVYGRARGADSYIHVMKADTETLDVIRVWRLPVEIGVYKNGFIACGILYLVKDLLPDETETEIDFAYDFYSDEHTAVNISLKMPYGKSTMFTFYTNTIERKKSVLLAWDSGNIIKYSLLF